MLNIFSLLVSAMLLQSIHEHLKNEDDGGQPEQPGHLVRGDEGGEKPEECALKRSKRNHVWRAAKFFFTSDPPIYEGSGLGWKGPLESHHSWLGPASKRIEVKCIYSDL